MTSYKKELEKFKAEINKFIDQYVALKNPKPYFFYGEPENWRPWPWTERYISKTNPSKLCNCCKHDDVKGSDCGQILYDTEKCEHCGCFVFKPKPFQP